MRRDFRGHDISTCEAGLLKGKLFIVSVSDIIPTATTILIFDILLVLILPLAPWSVVG